MARFQESKRMWLGVGTEPAWLTLWSRLRGRGGFRNEKFKRVWLGLGTEPKKQTEKKHLSLDWQCSASVKWSLVSWSTSSVGLGLVHRLENLTIRGICICACNKIQMRVYQRTFSDCNLLLAFKVLHSVIQMKSDRNSYPDSILATAQLAHRGMGVKFGLSDSESCWT